MTPEDLFWLIGALGAVAYIALTIVDWLQVREEYRREIKKMRGRK